jgi:bifunctional UDP-N-acetylglucosamine pyrophosphorylase / glucosamine-1-phosphate N-acetyltransferase
MGPSYFFEFGQFQHRALFDELEFVWEAISRIELYLKRFPLGAIEVEIPAGVHLVNPELISIGKGTVLEPGAYVKGPCVIGAKCTIRHGAYIRGDLIAGDQCVIGHDTEIKNSILLNQAHAAHFAYVGDSILGNRVNLGAGVKCANLKLDNGLIDVSLEGRRIPTGFRKLGAIIGDDSQIGCNAVTNPGTLIGRNVFCFPCLNISGLIPSDQIVMGTAGLRLLPKKK